LNSRRSRNRDNIFVNCTAAAAAIVVSMCISYYIRPTRVCVCVCVCYYTVAARRRNRRAQVNDFAVSSIIYTCPYCISYMYLYNTRKYMYKNAIYFSHLYGLHEIFLIYVINVCNSFDDWNPNKKKNVKSL